VLEGEDLALGDAEGGSLERRRLGPVR
jgi:hypothetical protein